MPIQVLINLFIAFLWMFFQDEWSILSFIGGYFVGIIVLFMMRRFFPTNFYLKRILSIINLFLLFISEAISSSIYVIRQVIGPKIDITPGIFKLETELEGDMEITLLALLLTLTPGSVVMEVSHDNKFFYLHGLNLPESEHAVIQSKLKYEKAIKEVTR
ncbi:multicomponent Na+:H+ antiporter subunit E [Cytobacillus eiseniae]|uniref:Multicomponent Na+:H+ antiporter subunit E n=1 Tax=Cytobacillus eiseniae TaxID=762947 RepID=A0ABS4RDN3_9BACI|nr:Na+/H+ antiporter subunit E [Cytobacillus eiseniae]MBP2241010.1 multicomponent Na+:H+ antiporter subunit E [Cytobacillus eiseniae]